MVPNRFIDTGLNMPFVPGLLQVSAMIDGNPIKPCAPRCISAELIHFAECLKENIVGCILRFLRITQKAQRKVINGPAMLLVNCGELWYGPASLPFEGSLACCRRFAHACVHQGLDSRPRQLSRGSVYRAPLDGVTGAGAVPGSQRGRLRNSLE